MKAKFVLAMALTSLIFAGCGEKGPDDPTTVEYTITVNAGDGGAAAAAIDGKAAAKAVEGAVVDITATADEGYEFVKWTTTTEGVAFVSETSADTKFTMPASDVAIEAEFKPATTRYTLTITPSSGGTVSSSPVNNIAAGTEVSLTATANTDYEFVKWTTDTEGVTFASETSASTTFTMPARDVTLAAQFRYANPVEGYVLINGVKWAVCNVDAPGTFAATPEDPGMFYQWNRKLGWSSTDPLVASDGSVDWPNPSNVPGEIWAAENDPSPEGWRVPTREELLSLTDASKINFTWVADAACPGLRLTDKATGNTMFLPAPGVRYSLIYGQLMLNTDEYDLRGASYWASEAADSDKSYAIHFTNAFGFITDQSYSKNDGFLVRPVADI